MSIKHVILLQENKLLCTICTNSQANLTCCIHREVISIYVTLSCQTNLDLIAIDTECLMLIKLCNSYQSMPEMKIIMFQKTVRACCDYISKVNFANIPVTIFYVTVKF